MKKYWFVFIAAFVLTSCNVLTNGGGIESRWDVAFCNAPVVDERVDELKGLSNIDPYQQIFLGSKLVFRGNKQFDFVLLDNYYHGSWQLDENKQWMQLTLQDSKDAISIKVDSITPAVMQLRFDSANFSKLHGLRKPKETKLGWFNKQMVMFRFSKDDEYLRDAKDPYSLENNQWRVKPKQAETEQQLKQRVGNHLQFFKLLFEDALDNERAFISYNWFVSPLSPAVNGIGLKNYKKVKESWEACFYDSTQAKQGYDILFKAFDKEIKFPEEEENKYKRSLNMIEQVINNMDK